MLRLKSDTLKTDLESATRNNITDFELNDAHGFKEKDLNFLMSYADQIKGLHIVLIREIDLSAIYKFKNIEYLSIDCLDKEIQEIFFDKLPNLRKCSLKWRTGAKSLFNSKSIEDLTLHKFNKKNLKDFEKMINLKKLHLNISPINSFEGVEKLVNLKRLYISRLSKLESLEGLDHLVGLQELRIENCNKISNIKPVKNLTSLKKFIIEDCGVIDSIKPIENLKNLKDVKIATEIKDKNLAPLIGKGDAWAMAKKGYSHSQEEIDKINGIERKFNTNLDEFLESLET